MNDTEKKPSLVDMLFEICEAQGVTVRLDGKPIDADHLKVRALEQFKTRVLDKLSERYEEYMRAQGKEEAE